MLSDPPLPCGLCRGSRHVFPAVVLEVEVRSFEKQVMLLLLLIDSIFLPCKSNVLLHRLLGLEQLVPCSPNLEKGRIVVLSP